MKLTDKACKAAEPSQKPRKLADGHGLYLEVMSNGSKYWRLKYRFAGKEKRAALGVYPTVSLKEARERREQTRRLLDNNLDPSLIKKEARLGIHANSQNTFEGLAHEWHSKQQDIMTPRHWETLLNRMERDIFPHIGQFPVNSVTPPVLLEVVRKVEARGAFDVARRIKQTCGQVFRYGVACGLAERDPTHDIKDALRPYKTEHYATLDIKEVPEFLVALECNEARLYPLTRQAIKLFMLTFVRTSELINAEWSEIDLDNAEWIIPPERMKMRRPHIVPLSKQAVEILKAIEVYKTPAQKFVFQNQADPRKAMSNATILGGFKRMGYKDRMTGHGFRALAMTAIKEKLGYRHEVVDRQLAHARKNKIVAAYDRAEFLYERRKMMQGWADYLDKLNKE